VEALAVGPPSLIANLLYAEVMKSDLMDGAAREDVRRRIEGAFRPDLGDTGEDGGAAQTVKPIRPAPVAPSGAAREVEEAAEKLAVSPDVARAELVERESRESKRETGTTVALGVASVVAGIGISIGTWFAATPSGIDRAALIATVVGTVLSMVLVVGVFVARQREQGRVQVENIQDAEATRSEFESYDRILYELQEAGARGTARISAAGPDSGVDMRVELEDGTVLFIEVKQSVDRRTLGRVAERLNQASQEQGSAEGVIVVLKPPAPDVMSRLERDLPDQIHLMTRDDFIHALRDDPAARRARMRRLK
jgi:hypothetical protein